MKLKFGIFYTLDKQQCVQECVSFHENFMIFNNKKPNRCHMQMDAPMSYSVNDYEEAVVLIIKSTCNAIADLQHTASSLGLRE